jgi:predicted nucleic acid-binding protein
VDKVFVDSNIILDLLAQRVPFFISAKELFKKAENGEIEILISTMSFISTEYILRKQIGKDKAKLALAAIKSLTTVCTSGEKTIELVLLSTMNDFEDAFQYYTALENSANVLITRDPKGFTAATIPVMNAEDYLKTI